MTIGKPALGTGLRPFPQARKTKAQRDEDAFMRIHGGSGSRLIYYIVETCSVICHGVHAIFTTFASFRRTGGWGLRTGRIKKRA